VVPLARCYLADDQTSNDEEAEELLRAVLSGRAFSPDALEYRDALTELGEHAYGQGRMSGDEGAIRLLEEAVERYPDHPRRAVLVFKLADASRQLGVSIGDELHKQMPSAERARLSEDRQNRHRSAMKMYQQVIDAVNARPARMLTDLDKLLRRNAMFYLGDCALELGDQPLAIKLYDAAAQAYASDPASLVARVQIVRAYVEQGRWAEAMTANERAKRQLAALPEGAMEDPNLPMQRRHGEKWLESDALLQQRRQAQGGGGNGGAGRGGRED
jgi:tetratricopeptide (TPR) repeat protein